MDKFTDNEKKILQRIQRGLPIDDDIYQIMADELAIASSDLLESIKNLKERKVIRNISGIFNQKKLGYSSTLVAFKVEEASIERVARVISDHSGVSHNYLRENSYNIWFTLSVPTEIDLKKEVLTLAAQPGVKDYLILRTEKMLKLGVHLNLGSAISEKSSEKSTLSEEENYELTPMDKEVVKTLLEDLPVEEKPFDKLLTTRPTMGREEFFKRAKLLSEKKILRRYGGVLNQYNSGYTSNALTVWKINGSDIETIKESVKKISNISHLYLRNTIAGKWDYPLFAMVHATDERELYSLIEEIKTETGLKDYEVLKSKKEFKKQRVRYFS